MEIEMKTEKTKRIGDGAETKMENNKRNKGKKKLFISHNFSKPTL